MSMRLRTRNASLSGRHPFLNTHNKRHAYKAGKTTQLSAYNFQSLPDSLERVFLQAIQYGDRHTVERCLSSINEKGKSFNVNCTDLLGRSGLMIAVDNENAELVELLLKHEGIKIGDALLYAIQEGSYPIVEMIINHPSVNKKMLGSGWGERMAMMQLESPEFSRDVSPVILAAICNQFEILQLLLNHEAWIEKPHQLVCACDKCALIVNKDSLRYSTLRINTYRALASPAWISLTNTDPILAAFKMSWELKNLALREAEFKEIYMELSEQCKQYACDLLDQCRSTDEVIAILNRSHSVGDDDLVHLGEASDNHIDFRLQMHRIPTINLSIFNNTTIDDVITAQPTPKASSKPSEHNPMRRHSLAFVEDVINDVMSGANIYQDFSKMTLPRLRMAVKYEQRQFVINPVCQQLLNSLWYSQIPGWRKQSFIVKVLVVIGLVVSLPFFALVYLVVPQTKIGRLVRSPFVKFLYHATSIALFLTLLCINFFSDHTARETQRGPAPDLIESLILWFVLGFVWSEMKQVWEEGFWTYIRQWWNYVDIAMLSLFLCTASLRAVAYVQVETGQHNLSAQMPRDQWPNDDPTFVAEAMFASACIFSFSRILFLFGLSQYLGPLQISLGRMLIDVGKFCLLFFLILTAFACGLHQLYCYNVVDEMHHPAFGTLLDSYRTLLWALFGHFHRYEIKINASDVSPNNPFSRLNFTERVGELLMICYLVVAMIILVNTLIAMITNSYDKIERQSDAEWKFARTKLWLDYFNDGSTLPPPLNIIISPKSIMCFCRFLMSLVNGVLNFCTHCTSKDDPIDSDISASPADETPQLQRMRQPETAVEVGVGVGAEAPPKPRFYSHRGSLPPTTVACGLNSAAEMEPSRGSSMRHNVRSLTMSKRGSVSSFGHRSLVERRLSILSAAFGHGGSANSTSGAMDRKYQEIMRKIVSRYILQRKKQYRDETVNEDDLLEIRQDISSLRYELREDRKHDQETRRSDIDRLKRELYTQLNDGCSKLEEKNEPGTLTSPTETSSSEMQSLRSELLEIRDELMGSIRELRKLVVERRDSLPHRSSIDQTYASDSLLERVELSNFKAAANANANANANNATATKDYRKPPKRQPHFGPPKF